MSQTPLNSSHTWRQGQLLELTITGLSDRGDGLGRYQERVVFVPDTAPGDRVRVRLIRVKPSYAFGHVDEMLQASPHRVRPACIVADKCGGCQWQQVDYAAQQTAKQQQIIDALLRIGGFATPIVKPLLPVDRPLGYRNKSTYPFSQTEAGQLQAGYYRKGSHRLINLNQCPVQDPRLDPLLACIKRDLQSQGWPAYDEKCHTGVLRHLSLRVGRRTGQQLLTLITTQRSLPGLADQAQQWLQQYPDLVGVNLNYNPERTNHIFGSETHVVAGQPYLEEVFANLKLRIRADTFFQIYTEQAEALLNVIVQTLQLSGQEQIVDAYCGIGTLTLPLAQHCAHITGLEVQPEAIAQARDNASLNQITNVDFHIGSVESLLLDLQRRPNIVILDPPRKGCDRDVITTLKTIAPKRLVYMSCNPATLARDLKQLCAQQQYQLEWIQPADFFPQTPHVECVAFLQCKST